MRPGAIRDFVLILSVSLLLSALIIIFFGRVMKGLMMVGMGALITPIIFLLVKQMLPERRFPGSGRE